MRPINYLCCCLLLLWAGAGQAAPGPDQPTLEKSGAEFVQNLGQWPAPVRFAAALRGGRLFLEDQGLTYVLATPATGEAVAEPRLVPTRAWAYQV